MVEIKGVDGSTVRRSQNLRGIREQLRYVFAESVRISLLSEGRGELYIIFQDGSSVQTVFGSFDVLRHCLKYWRKLYGASLYVNGNGVGRVGFKNIYLQCPELEATAALKRNAERVGKFAQQIVLSSDASPAKKTELVWRVFVRLENHELDAILNAAGVVPCKDRALKLNQALTVWFHGEIPSITELTNLSGRL